MITEDLKQQCIDYFKSLILNELPCGFVAGGAVRDWFSRSRITSDVDVWFANESDYVRARMAMGTPDFENDGLANFKRRGIKIQLIKRVYFNAPSEVLSYFDFTISCGAVSKDEVIVHPQYFVDLCRRSLVIANLPHPRSTLSRVLKYERKGFRMCPIQLNKLAKAINTLPASELEEPVFYVD